MSEIENLIIVGAGFSSYAGLPLTGGFTKALLAVEKLPEGPSKASVSFLKRFIRDAFDHSEEASAKFWPELEDLFTCVDLAANSGHHLGRQYEPARLRTVRRALIVRIIKMLRQHSGEKYRERAKWEQLQQFCSAVDIRKTAFISMNWDTVIEETLQTTQGIAAIDYCCDARSAELVKSSVRLRNGLKGEKAQILKMHGSVNWMYCDNCREMFWFPPKQSSKIATLLFTQRDWELMKAATIKKEAVIEALCPCCGAQGLGARLATFSYRKALECPMFHKSWLSAEHLLRKASTWIFVGYSLPGADYEFKYLLKRTQLARNEALHLIVITGGESEKAKETYRNYQRFFGRGISMSKAKRSYFKCGLATEAIEYLQEIGALKSL